MAPEVTTTTTAPTASAISTVPTAAPVAAKSIDIESMIPEEVRVAKEKRDAEIAKTEPKVEEKTRTESVKTTPRSDDDPDDAEDAGNEDDGEELDLSVDAIDKFLEDDDDTVLVKKKATKKEEGPAWHKEPEYQEIIKKAERAGIKGEELDTLIRKVADSSKVESSEYTANLTKERDTLKTQLKDYDAEVARLRKVEKAAHFDMNVETQEKFTKPMGAAIDSAREILDREGVAIPVMQLLSAPNRVKFADMIADIPFEDGDRVKLNNIWREYQDLNKGYSNAKLEAQTNLAKQLSIEITPKESDTILKSGLYELIEQNEEFRYIRDAIADGLQKHPEVNTLIGDAKMDLRNLMLAISNPVDHVNSQPFKQNLAQYVIDNVDAKMKRAKLPVVEKELATRTAQFEKLLKKYTELKGSGRGIQGITGTSRNGHQKISGDTTVAAAEQKKIKLESFFKGNTDFDEL